MRNITKNIAKRMKVINWVAVANLGALILLSRLSSVGNSATLATPKPSGSPTSTGIEATFGAEVLRMRDPFRKPSPPIELVDTRTDLEKFPVDTFKLLGITTGPRDSRALILAPTGKTYLARLNTKLGINGGIIKKITRDRVLVREKVVNIIGQEENVDMEIVLPGDTRLSENSFFDVGPKTGPSSKPPSH